MNYRYTCRVAQGATTSVLSNETFVTCCRFILLHNPHSPPALLLSTPKLLSRRFTIDEQERRSPKIGYRNKFFFKSMPHFYVTRAPFKEKRSGKKRG